MILERRAFERKLNEKIQKNPQFSLTFSHLAPATTYVLAVKFPVVCEQLLEHPLSELLTHTLPSSSTFPEITEILSSGEALGYARFENKNVFTNPPSPAVAIPLYLPSRLFITAAFRLMPRYCYHQSWVGENCTVKKSSGEAEIHKDQYTMSPLRRIGRWFQM